MPGHPMAANMPYARPLPRPVMRDRVPRLAYRLFLALFAFSLLNVSGIITTLVGQPPVPINPLVFGIVAIPIVLMTAPRPQAAYFWMAWAFWLAYAVGGFLGPHQATGESNYFVAQIVFKIWINMIGIPWLALRCISQEKLPRLVKTAYIVIGFGAILAVIQVFIPTFILSDNGRGAGLWIDSNGCGALCGVALYLSLMYPLRSKSHNVAIRLILFFGLLSSMSRAAILAFAICLVVYGLATKRFGAVVKSAAAVLAISIGGAICLQFLDTSGNPEMTQRVELVRNFLHGDFSTEQQVGRLEIWRRAIRAISKDWLLGRGHGSMNYVVNIRGGLGPHNYYLYVWGNSGILALLMLLLYLATLMRIGLQCRETSIRAGMLSAGMLLTLYTMFAHDLFVHQFLGPIFSLLVLIGVYGQRRSRGPLPVGRMPFPPPVPSNYGGPDAAVGRP